MSRPATVRADLAAKREEMLETILQAAIAEFAAHGLHGASTQAIADRASISKTKLHYYISSKEDLYLDALRHIVGIWSDLFHGLDMTAGPEPFLRDYIARKVRQALEAPEVARLFTGEVMRGAPFLRPMWEKSRHATQAAAQVIEGWVASGLIRPVDPVLLQFHIWSLTQHYALHLPEVRFMLGLPEGSNLDADHIIAEVTELVLRGLRP
jgi:AcrR family transcriptional regulator